MKHLLLLTLAALLLAAGCTQPAPEAVSTPWWKGNLHTHSLWSDGDDYPEMIMDWYKEQGYHFMALSDHNILAEGEKWVALTQRANGRVAFQKYRDRFGDDGVTWKIEGADTLVRLKTLDEYRPLFEEAGTFLIIKAEEITDGAQDKSVHVNATNIRELILPQGGSTVREAMQNNVDAVLEQRARTGQPMFPHINHPNFGWSVTAEDLIALHGERFFEVYNGHPAVHNEGDSLRPSTERMWDIILTERLAHGEEVLYGIAIDDAHNYHEVTSELSNPGRGWVMVRAAELTPDALIAAMEAGDFYGTSGVTLLDIRQDGSTLRLEIEPEEGVTYTTQFIGTRQGYDPHSEPIASTEIDAASVTRRYSDDIGVVLAEVEGTSPSYTFSGDEIYVRARVVSSTIKANPYREGHHEMAWTQPVVR